MKISDFKTIKDIVEVFGPQQVKFKHYSNHTFTYKFDDYSNKIHLRIEIILRPNGIYSGSLNHIEQVSTLLAVSLGVEKYVTLTINKETESYN